MRSVLRPAGFGYAELGQQGSCANFKRVSAVGGLSGQHFLKQLVHDEASLAAAADRARDSGSVRSRGKLLGDSRGIGEDLVTFGRRRGVW